MAVAALCAAVVATAQFVNGDPTSMKSILDYEPGDDGETRHLKSLARVIVRVSGASPEDALRMAADELSESGDPEPPQSSTTDPPGETD